MKLRSYVLLACFSLLLFSIALLPASFAWKLLPEDLKRGLPLQVEQIGGTIWKGFVVGQLSHLPTAGAIQVSWAFRPWRLFLGEAAAGLNAENRDFKLSGLAHVGLANKGVRGLNGVLSSELLNPMIQQMNATVGGALRITQVALILADENKVSQAEGELSWNGGPVSFQQGMQAKQVDFPAIKGRIQQQGEGLLVDVVELAGGEKIAKLTLQGVLAGVTVYKRVIRLAGQGNPYDEDGTLIQLQQPLLL